MEKTEVRTCDLPDCFTRSEDEVRKGWYCSDEHKTEHNLILNPCKRPDCAKVRSNVRRLTQSQADTSLERMHSQHRAQVAQDRLGRTLVDNDVMLDLVRRLHAALQNERDRHSDVSEEDGYWAETDEILQYSYDWT